MKLVSSKEKCCGCTACYNACPHKAITLKEDDEGFLYPVIDEEKCIECGLCARVCPLQQKDVEIKTTDSEIKAMKYTEDSVRMNSSSGGAFTAISDWVLQKDGVVYGCAYDEKIRAVHIRANNKDMRDLCRGSKYVQSDLQNIFSVLKKDLLENKQVMFTGTPCQVAGLKSYLGKEYLNLLTVDFVCHGVPSPKIFAEHISFLEQRRRDKVVKYYNRSKEKGWGNHVERVEYEHGHVDSKSVYSQAYKQLFYSSFVLRPSCYSCPYACMNRVSDITIADFWGIENCVPDFKDELGVSLIMYNTEKGKSINNYLESVEIKDVQEMNYERQPMLKAPCKRPNHRDEFWSYYYKCGYAETIKKYTSCNFIGRLKNVIKRILKMPM